VALEGFRYDGDLGTDKFNVSKVTSPKLQLLSPTFLRSSNCSPSLWSVAV